MCLPGCDSLVACNSNQSILFDLEPISNFSDAALGLHRLDVFTHARLWRNPCGFSARFNYLGLRYNTPLYGWVEARFGLSRAEFVVIYSLGLMTDVTASEIAASTAFPKNTLSRAVNRLAKMGLIQRNEGQTDRRQQNLSLTPQGRAVLDEALPRFVALEAEMLAPLTLVEQETLSALMAKVVLAMFENSPEPTPAKRAVLADSIS